MTQLVPRALERDDEDDQTPERTGSTGFAGPPVAPSPPPTITRPEPERPEPEQPAVADTEGVAGLGGLEPEFARRLAALIKASGGRITINSGYRSVEEQARLYQQGIAKYGAQGVGKWVAPPGKSNHNRGLAADLGGDLELAHRLAPAYGLHFPMSHEDWHIEPAGVRTDPATPAEAYTEPGTKEKPASPQEHMAILVDTILADAATRLATQPQGFGHGPLDPVRPPEIPEREQEQKKTAPEQVGVGGDCDSWIREAMRITGKPESLFPHYKKKYMQESGCRNIPQGIQDVNTAKGTPAFGPAQVIEPTFRSHALPGYEDWKNPVHNIIASIRYIDSKYGGDIQGVAARGGGY